jgi:hypothetical protein
MCFSGLYLGDGTSCVPNTCPPTGSCCAAACCTVTREAGCPGTWTSGSTCTSVVCSTTPPPNDECVSAIALAVGVPAVGQNCTATTDVTVSCASSSRDVWYEFTADSNGGAYVFDTEGSPQIDTVLAIFSGCGGTQLACDDDSGTGFRSRIVVALTAQQQVRVRVASFGSASAGGGYVLSVTDSTQGAGACCRDSGGPCAVVLSNECLADVYLGDNSTCGPNPCQPTGACCPPNVGCCVVTRQAGCMGVWTSGAACGPGRCEAPVNDVCANAAELVMGVAAVGSNCNATTDATVSCTISALDVWYGFTADGAGGMHFFDTEGTTQIDTALALFSGCGGAQLACNDDSGTGTNSRIEFVLSANQSVRIRVASFGTSPPAGAFQLNVTVPDAGACCCGARCLLRSAASCAGANQAFVGLGTSCTPYSTTVPCCRADFNKSGGSPTVQDIFDFLAAYFAGDLCTDAGDGGTVSVQDIFDFLAAYFVGCG